MVVSHFLLNSLLILPIMFHPTTSKRTMQLTFHFDCKKSRFTLHRSGTKSRTTTGQCASTQSWDFPQYVQWVQFCRVLPLVCEQLVWSFTATAMHHRIMGVVRVQILSGSSCSLVAAQWWLGTYQTARRWGSGRVMLTKAWGQVMLRPMAPWALAVHRSWFSIACWVLNDCRPVCCHPIVLAKMAGCPTTHPKRNRLVEGWNIYKDG